MMTQALGTIATVKKTRILMMRDHVRLHLDRVDGLGEFGEIEAVLGEHGDPESEPSRGRRTSANSRRQPQESDRGILL